MGVDLGPLIVSLAECKAYLRIEHDDEDAMLAGLVRTAAALCEAFTGQWLLSRPGVQALARHGDWQRISVKTVSAITAVAVAGLPLPVSDYAIDIDASGVGWVRLQRSIDAVAPIVSFRAGLADDWNGVPEPLRQGIIRLVGHFYTHRDAADAGAPPAAVAAMWRPWRLLRLA